MASEGCAKDLGQRDFVGLVLRSEPQFADAPCVATPAMKPPDLIETARVLAASGSGDPAQARPRRAVGAANIAKEFVVL